MLSRRELMAGLLAATATGSRAGVVLVHGAWHGGWCWDGVVKHLADAGVTAVAPTLAGLAERAPELTARTTLSTHADDVLAAAGSWERVVLVGHSYGGLVLSQAFGAFEEPRVAGLVYLDAFLPNSGQSGFDLLKPEYVKHWKDRAGAGLTVPPMLSARAMGVLDPLLAKQVDARLTPHPIATFEAKVTFDDTAWRKIPRHYLRCSRYGGFAPTAIRARTLGLDVEEFASGHDAMVTDAPLLAKRLGTISAKLLGKRER